MLIVSQRPFQDVTMLILPILDAVGFDVVNGQCASKVVRNPDVVNR
jgi:hypothetical protein